MDMSVPTPLPLALDPGAALRLALVLGLAFGVVLERAGLGDARKLTAQFYLRDLTVFKVMLSAIVTAMLGLVALDRLGVLDATRLARTPTYLAPQILGGLVFGVGFVLGGYCPGTSCVAAARGRLDALAVIGGLLAGTALFGELFPALEPLYRATPLGHVTLPELLHLPPAIVAAGIVGLALVAFAAAERLEGARSGEARTPAARPLARLTATLAGLAGLAVAVSLLLVLAGDRGDTSGPTPRLDDLIVEPSASTSVALPRLLDRLPPPPPPAAARPRTPTRQPAAAPRATSKPTPLPAPLPARQSRDSSREPLEGKPGVGCFF
jgi:hypothetical protein